MLGMVICTGISDRGTSQTFVCGKCIVYCAVSDAVYCEFCVYACTADAVYGDSQKSVLDLSGQSAVADSRCSEFIGSAESCIAAFLGGCQCADLGNEYF